MHLVEFLSESDASHFEVGLVDLRESGEEVSESESGCGLVVELFCDPEGHRSGELEFASWEGVTVLSVDSADFGEQIVHPLVPPGIELDLRLGGSVTSMATLQL